MKIREFRRFETSEDLCPNAPLVRYWWNDFHRSRPSHCYPRQDEYWIWLDEEIEFLPKKRLSQSTHASRLISGRCTWTDRQSICILNIRFARYYQMIKPTMMTVRAKRNAISPWWECSWWTIIGESSFECVDFIDVTSTEDSSKLSPMLARDTRSIRE